MKCLDSFKHNMFGLLIVLLIYLCNVFFILFNADFNFSYKIVLSFLFRVLGYVLRTLIKNKFQDREYILVISWIIKGLNL